MSALKVKLLQSEVFFDSPHSLNHHMGQEILQDTSRAMILFWTKQWNLRGHGTPILVFGDLVKTPISVTVVEFAQVTLELIPIHCSL